MEFLIIGYCLNRFHGHQKDIDWSRYGFRSDRRPSVNPVVSADTFEFENPVEEAEIEKKQEQNRVTTLFNVARTHDPEEKEEENTENTEKEDKCWAILIEDSYFFQCPHCQGGVQVLQKEVACKNFRHGSYKQPENPQIPPHLPQAQCEALVASGQINGCGKPFLFVYGPHGKHYVKKCGYF